MRLEELKEGVVYTSNIGYVFKLEDQKLLIRDEYYNEWKEAVKFLPIAALAGFKYSEIKTKPVFTEEEKKLAKHALELGLKVIVKDKDSLCYCMATKDIKIDDSGYWVVSDNNINKFEWIYVESLPALSKSSLIEKVTHENPIFLEDVVK